ncbi:unnamed protein product [Leuciscus chuanchicus]
MGDRVWFDGTGSAVAQYEVINWQQDSDGSVQFKTVGYYDASLPPHQRFVLNSENIIWAGGQLEKPRSVCSESCPPGTRKAAQKGRPVCCYDCISCAEGEISNETDHVHPCHPHPRCANGQNDLFVLREHSRLARQHHCAAKLYQERRGRHHCAAKMYRENRGRHHCVAKMYREKRWRHHCAAKMYQEKRDH